MNIEEKITKLLAMSDDVWRRHANPLSVWTRFTILPIFPEHHKLMPNILNLVSTFGIPFVIWGVWQLEIWPTVVGSVFIYAGKLWFLDRMGWLFMVNIRTITSTFLFLFFILLAILVPGGPIETRGFSHIDPIILGAFNTFLTSLGMFSLLLMYFVIKNKRWSFIASTLCRASYFIVYALDLGGIFPVSPDSMPQALFVIEILGSVIALPIIFVSIKEVMNSSSEQAIDDDGNSRSFTYVVFSLVLMGIGVIIFATKSAMGN